MPVLKRRVALEQEPEAVRTFLERVEAAGVDVIIEHEGRPVLAITRPAGSPQPSGGSEWSHLTVAERAAWLHRLHGAWEEVDTESLKASIYEARKRDRRRAVSL